jgi:hypothetical protein
MRNIFILLTIWVLIFTGCFHVEAIRTTIAPAGTKDKKYPAKMAVHFSPQLRQLVEIKNPDTSYGNKHTYYYIMGPSLQAALIKSVESAYSNVSLSDILPSMGEYARIISFDLESSKVIVEFVPGYLSQEAKATAVVGVMMEVIDGSSLKTIRRVKWQGSVTSTRDASGFNAYASKHFASAMEDAIEQLAEKASKLLISGAAESRWRAKRPPRQK